MGELSHNDLSRPVANGYRGVERRRNGHGGLPPSVALDALPALVVLERIPAPVLAIGHDGSILYANAAFATMVGHSPEELRSLTFAEIFHILPTDESAVSVFRTHAESVVELAHADGFTLRARMSRSALLRGDDPVALATFQDLTEDMWHQP